MDETGQTTARTLDPTTQADPPTNWYEQVALEQVSRRLLGQSRAVTIGRYTIARELGRGGCGAVYQGHDPELGRPVAVKLVLLGRRQDAKAQARLVREARALARVGHPNVVEVFDVGIDARGETGGVYVVMELLRGTELGTIANGAPGWQRLVELYVQAARGLHAAHMQGVVHRDFKPSNAMLADDGRLKVIDFGLATHATMTSTTGEIEAPTDEWNAPGSTSHLTSVGTVMGTPAYMPPEQHGGNRAELGPAADQYALCVALFEALHGHRPFVGDSVQSLLKAKLRGQIAAPSSRSSIPRALERTIVRGLHAYPERRWPSMAALADALERQARARPRRRVWLVAAGTVVLAGGLVRTVGASEDASPCRDVARRHAALLPAPRAEAIKRQLLAEDAAIGADPWTRTQATLSPRLTQWHEAFRQACANDDDAAVQCLDDWLTEADTLLSVLETADANTAGQAVALAASLPDLARCDPRADAHAVADRPGDDPARRRDLARSRALARAGQLDEAAALARDVLARARAQGDVRGQAFAGLTAGVAEAEREQLGDAYALLVEAADLADTEGLDGVAVEASTALVRVLGALGRFEDARRWASLADARIASLGRPVFMQRWLLGARSFALIYEGDFEGAHQAATALAAISPADEVPWIRGRTLANVAIAAFELGRVDEARAGASEAMSLMAAELGDEHPAVARMRTDAGRYACAAGDVAGGVAMMERGVADLEAAGGPRDPYALNAKRTIAMHLPRLGRADDALAMLVEVYEATRALYGDDHVRTAVTGFALADAYLGAARPDEAEVAVRRSMDALTHLYGAGSPRLSDGHELMARILAERGERASARDMAQRALEALSPDTPAQRESIQNLTLLLADLDAQDG